MGSVWGDYDNDGYEDLFVYKWGRPELFHNDGGQGLHPRHRDGRPPGLGQRRLRDLARLRPRRPARPVPRRLLGRRLDLWHLKTTKMMPESFEYAKNGGRKYLLPQPGRRHASRTSPTAVGIDSRRWALCAAAADLRGTGYPDLFIANDYGVSELFANQQGKSFREIGKPTGVGFAPKSGMNVAFGDIFNQGRFSVYVTNISEEGVLIQGNNLWVPQGGDRRATRSQYENLAGELGVELGGWSFGAQFGDLNNDGTQDLILTNGYVSAAKGTSYWYDSR